MSYTKTNEKIWDISLLGMFTAIVVVLQLFAPAIKIGMFSFSLVLLPIVIGAALADSPLAGGWLGLVFGGAVLLSPETVPFWQFSAVGTVVVVLSKGILAGLAAGVVYRLLAKKNKTAAVIAAAVVCPVVNTGVFALGSYLFFWQLIKEWAGAAEYANAAAYLFLIIIGLNFLLELGTNLLLSPVAVRLIQFGKGKALR